MELTAIKSDVQYEQYLDWGDKLFDKKITPDSSEGKTGGSCFVVN
jgi:hypothetical protein